MINGNINNSPIRSVKGEVELIQSSTFARTFQHDDYLSKITIERLGNMSKFFGYGICQKLTVVLTDKNREIKINKGDGLKPYLTTTGEFPDIFPIFTVDDVKRDENTNGLTLTAYDAIQAGAAHVVSELSIEAPYTLADIARACASIIGASGIIANAPNFSLEYPEGANLDGTETIRDILDAIAEVTQTIYYLKGDNTLVFKYIDKDVEPALTITKADYFTLQDKAPVLLRGICHITELGNNIIASLPVAGHTQYINNNPFLELREDVDAILNTALRNMNGLYMTQFDCSWRGNYFLEPGDKIALVTKDDKTIISYFINDKIEYTGGMKQTTSYICAEDTKETVSANPSTLGEALKNTYAKVDKVNQEISIVAQSAADNKKNIASIQADLESISLDVSEQINGLTEQVSLALDKEQVKIEIEERLEDGVDKVITSTGFTFNEDGLTIDKANSEMSTQITEDGMTVSKSGQVMLTANNQGVEATNLNATTYLIIGKNSRFEDYGSNRTGCFWIGG